MKESGEYTLVSTSMTPAYDEKGFSLGTYDELEDKTDHKELLRILT